MGNYFIKNGYAFTHPDGSFTQCGLLCPLSMAVDPALAIKDRDRGLAPKNGDGPWYCLTRLPKDAKVTSKKYTNLWYGSEHYMPTQNEYWYNSSPTRCSAVTWQHWNGWASGSVMTVEPYTKDGIFYCKVKEYGESFPNATSQSVSELMARLEDPPVWSESLIGLYNSKGWLDVNLQECVGEATFTDYSNYVGLLTHDNFDLIANYEVYPGHIAQGCQGAYIAACNDVPQLSVNMFANVMDALDAVRTAYSAIKHPIKALKRLLRDASDPRETWLSYRYQYLTTKADVQEIKNLMQRLEKLKDVVSETLTVSASNKVDGITYECHMEIPLSQCLPSGLADFGFNPSLLNAWDLVPYSFIVDWVLPVSDLLEQLDMKANSLEVSPTSIWYVMRHSVDGAYAYMRVRGRALDCLPIYAERSTSTKTFVFRLADTISLFT